MADVNITFGTDDSLDKLKKDMQDILKLVKDIKKADIIGDDEAVKAKNLAAAMLKAENALKRQEQTAERLATTSQKRADSLKQEKGIIGSLEKEVRDLTKAWKSATTQAEKLDAKANLDKVKKKLTDAKNTTASWGKALGSFQFKFNALGNIAANALSKISQGAKEFLREALQMSLEMEGVRNAFNKINDPNLLKNLQNATRDTVNNLELMKGAVTAKNLRIPIEQLSTFFEFATDRAIETGESVDFLVDSIVKGLGRKSVLILDNLGLNVVEINEEFNKTGNFVEAAANIIEREMESAGEVLDTNLILLKQHQTEFENLKIDAGFALQELAIGGTNLIKATTTTDGLMSVTYNRLLKKTLKEIGEEMEELDKNKPIVLEEVTVVAEITTLKKLREELSLRKAALESTNIQNKSAIQLLQQQIKELEDQIESVENIDKAEEEYYAKRRKRHEENRMQAKLIQDDSDETTKVLVDNLDAFIETYDENQDEYFEKEEARNQQEQANAEQRVKITEDEENRKKAIRLIAANALQQASNQIFSSQQRQLDAYYRAELEAAKDNETRIKEIQKEQAEAEQDLAVKRALVDGALAIVKTYASYGGFTPQAIAAAIAQAAVTGIQVAAIKSQKFEHGGLVEGARHTQGGVQAELEGGEYVINRRSTSKYKQLLEGINENDQLKIMMALDKDRAVTTVNRDPYTKKMYDFMRNQTRYGETPSYYVEQRGNLTIKYRKN